MKQEEKPAIPIKEDSDKGEGKYIPGVYSAMTEAGKNDMEERYGKTSLPPGSPVVAEREEFYKGELNTKRIAAYKKLTEQYNISESSVRDIFCAGIDFASSATGAKDNEGYEKIIGRIKRNAEKINGHTWKVYKEQILEHIENAESLRQSPPTEHEGQDAIEFAEWIFKKEYHVHGIGEWYQGIFYEERYTTSQLYTIYKQSK